MRQRLVAFVLASFPVVAAPAWALDPGRAPSQYVIKKWGVTSLQSNTVHALLQTRDRYLWLGTSAGLMRYDGARFVTFNRENTPSFGDGGVSRLAEGPDGALFVGLMSGTVLRYKDGVFMPVPFASATGYVSSLLATRDGTIWAGVFSGFSLAGWREGLADLRRPSPDLIAAHALAEDKDGGMWIGTRNRGVALVVEGKLAERLAVTSEMVQALHFDRAGRLWIGTRHGLLRMDGKTVAARFTHEDGLSNDNVTAVREDRQGNLWVGTGGGGLNRFTNGRWSRLAATVDGLSDDDVRCLLEDHEGNVWVGTANGLTALSDGAFVTYGRPEGLGRPSVMSVTGGAGGRVWVGNASGQLMRLQGTSTSYFDLPTGGGLEAVLALHEARDGSVWIALDNGRLLRFANGAFTDESPSGSGDDRLPKVVGFFEDDKGLVVLTPTLGLGRLEKRRLVPWRADMPRFAYPHVACRDREGTLWIGDKTGLLRFRDDKWTTFTEKEGLPNRRVRWISEDQDGGIWLATLEGLAHLKGDTIHTVTAAQGLPESYLRLVLDDGRGHVWVASTGHLFRLEKTELRELFAGKRSKVSIRRFNTFDGLRTTEMLLSNSPGFRTPEGRLWFATAQGASMIDPATSSTNTVPPAVRVEEVKVDDREIDGRTAIDAPPGRGDLAIRYTALSFVAPERVQFRYRLEGYDDDWVEAGNRRAAFYTNLPPGRYHFRVAATNNDGVSSEKEAQLFVYLAPHFYQTGWFRGGSAVTLLLGLWGAYRRRVGLLKARQRELAVRVDEGLAEIKVLRGMLPTCASCHRTRDENGAWSNMESYIREHSEAHFSHGVCPECTAKLYPDYHRTRAGA